MIKNMVLKVTVPAFKFGSTCFTLLLVEVEFVLDAWEIGVKFHRAKEAVQRCPVKKYI